jgi:hypothetical protein
MPREPTVTDESTPNGDAVAYEGHVPAEVLQAEGALSARRGISVDEAAESLRAIAQCAGTPLIDVARHVLAGRDSVDRTP